MAKVKQIKGRFFEVLNSLNNSKRSQKLVLAEEKPAFIAAKATAALPAESGSSTSRQRTAGCPDVS